MKAALLLLAWPQAAPAPQSGLAPTLRGEARVVSVVRAVEVGEPFALELEVRHTAGDAPRIDAAALEADPTWAVLSADPPATLPDPSGDRLALTRARWLVVSLEPGERELPAPAVSWPAPEGSAESITVARGRVEVGGVLAEGEDAPRPLGEFAGLESAERGRERAAAALAIALVLAAGGIAWLLHRRKRLRAVPAAAGPTPLERLARLEEAALDQPAEVAEAHVELARALREAIDGSLGAPAPGLTDCEWAEALAARVGSDSARACAQLLKACEPVKYGAERPTHWAARERIARARELAVAVVGARAGGGGTP